MWVMGTEMTQTGNAAGLLNCAFVSTDDMTRKDPGHVFGWMMEASMLGIGVGFDGKGADKMFTVYEQSEEVNTFVIPDTREGWADSLRRLINSYLKLGQERQEFDYSQIRPAGSPIKTFGGTASGPEPLRQLHDAVRDILDARIDESLTLTDIADIGNLIGVCVVAGNVRRSAELFMGPATPEFLGLKDYGNESGQRRAGWSWMSNNTVEATVDMDLDPLVPGILANGEPGILWIDMTRQYGRLSDPRNDKDYRVAGTNPCFPGSERILTENGWVTFADAYAAGTPNRIVVDGRVSYADDGGPESAEKWKINVKDRAAKAVTMDASHVFMTKRDADIVKVELGNGMSVRATPDHLVATKVRGMVAAAELTEGEKVLITRGHEPEDVLGMPSTRAEIDAVLMGLIAGDGFFTRGAVTDCAHVGLWGQDLALQDQVVSWINDLFASHGHLYVSGSNRPFTACHVDTVSGREHVRVSSSFLAAYLKGEYGFEPDTKHTVPPVLVERASSRPARFYVAALAFCDGTINKYNKVGSSSARISQANREMLKDVQLICLANGITSSLYKRRDAGLRALPDGHGGSAEYMCRANYELVFMMDASVFAQKIGFLCGHKQETAKVLTPSRKRNAYASVVSVTPDGVEDVYCLREPVRRIMCVNGVTVRRCAEQSLESFECCTLVETFISRAKGQAQYLRALKFAYLYAKTVTLMTTPWPETNAIMLRNRRIGTGMSGIADFYDEHGESELVKWQNAGYAEIQRLDKQYSEWLGIRESIKTSTVKPSGTVSLLAGVSPGVHWQPGQKHYYRLMRVGINDPLVVAAQRAGYRVEPSVTDPGHTMVIYFPMIRETSRGEHDVSLLEKLNLAILTQKFWSDNAVSVTLSYHESERDQIGPVLKLARGNLKSVSFLPLAEGTYEQMPYTATTCEAIEADTMTHFPMDLEYLYRNGQDAIGEKFCTTDTCEL